MERGGFVNIGTKRIRKGGGATAKSPNFAIGMPRIWVSRHHLDYGDETTQYMGMDGTLVILPGGAGDEVVYADSYEELIRRHNAVSQARERGGENDHG